LGKKLSKTYNLKTVNPKLAKEWHPSKNGKLTPIDVMIGSSDKAWWICNKGHEWEASIRNRVAGHGCHYCTNQKVYSGNCLATLRPELAKEWHPRKNGKLTPKDVMCGSNKKVWWLCKKGHAWEGAVANKSANHGCPYCANQKVYSGNCLATVKPELVKEWHPYKNGKLTPKDVMPGSNRKVWWKCGHGHVWLSSLATRRKSGCPYCKGRKACKDNCLNTKNPELAKKWHPYKNGSLTPENVTANSNKIVWWKCEKGHEWKNRINSEYGKWCPYCKNKKVCRDNCLAAVNPKLAKEWHPYKNGKLTPGDVTAGTGRKVWWKCKKGHEWEAACAGRNQGDKCPYCAGRRVCKDNCLSTVNPKLAAEWHPKRNGKLTPEYVTQGSSKRVWWICELGHTWTAKVCDRKINKCRECSYIFMSLRMRRGGGSVGVGIAKELTSKLRQPSRLRIKYMNKQIENWPFAKLKKLEKKGLIRLNCNLSNKDVRS